MHVSGTVVSAGTVTVGGLLVFSVGDTSVRQLASSHDPFPNHEVNSVVVMLEQGVITPRDQPLLLLKFYVIVDQRKQATFECLHQ